MQKRTQVKAKKKPEVESCSIMDAPKQNDIKKIVSGIEEEIKGRNVSYSMMSKMEKRVAIAQDVLDQIAAKKIIPKRGTYLTFDGYGYDIKDKEVTCTACAIGSTFVAFAAREGLKSNFYDDDSMIRKMEKSGIFSQKELRIMELLFEIQTIGMDENEYSMLGINPFRYRNIARHIREKIGKRTTASAMLKYIMQNIIDNKGHFVHNNEVLF